MELRHLRYFVAVAEELHFGRAAERVGIAQPPLSQQIQKLEREMEVTLFHRTKRKVELTEAGRVFLPEARRALDRVARAVEAAQRAESGQVGRLIVGFVGSATYAVLPRVLRGFRRQQPGVELSLREMTTAQQVAALEEKEIDLGFVRTPPPSPQLDHHVLAEEEFVAALPRSHRLAHRGRIALRDLRDDAFILFPRALAPGLYDRIVSASQQAGFSPRIIQETTQTPVMIGLVAAGLGVALVPACVRTLAWRNVVYRPLLAPRPTTNLTLMWRRDRMAAAVRAFVDYAASTKAGLGMRSKNRATVPSDE